MILPKPEAIIKLAVEYYFTAERQRRGNIEPKMFRIAKAPDANPAHPSKLHESGGGDGE